MSRGTLPIRLVDLQDFHRNTSPGSIQAMCLAIKGCSLIFINTKHHPCYISIDLFSDISLIRCKYWNYKKYKNSYMLSTGFLFLLQFLSLDWHGCHFATEARHLLSWKRVKQFIEKLFDMMRQELEMHHTIKYVTHLHKIYQNEKNSVCLRIVYRNFFIDNIKIK